MIIIFGIKIYLDSMLVSFAPDLDVVGRHGSEIHHTTLVSSQWSVVR